MLLGTITKPVPEQATEKVFPADSGIVNVKTAYGAKGDGVTDDTQAILRAIRENVGTHKTLYFPVGTYIVSERLEARGLDGKWHSDLRLQGQSREGTIIKLKDNAVGYGDPARPKALIYTASSLFVADPYSGGKNYPGLGEGNEAFNNYIDDLTLDTGIGNRGAIGIDYLANNHGALRNVTIRGKGVVGLSMVRKWPGPCLMQDVHIEGFDYGVSVANKEYGVTFEDLLLENQRVAGIRNRDNILSIRGLESANAVPVVRNETPAGLVTLIDGAFRGGSSAISAVENSGVLYARNIVTTGYKSAIQGRSGASVTEYTSHRTLSLFPSPKKSLNLPVAETPTYHDNNLSNWANVADYGAIADDWGDDTDAIQAALDSGKSTVYFPEGSYFVQDTLHVRGNVRKIAGMGSRLAASLGAFGDADNPRPLFRIENGGQGVIVVERLSITKLHQTWPSYGLIGFEQATSRAFVLRDVSLYNEYKYAYRSTAEAGPLFIEDVYGSKWLFDHPQSVWARQLNPESGDRMVWNNGAKLWVLGIKTEGPSTVIETAGGGQTELLGGLLYPYPTEATFPAGPAFVNRESSTSLLYAVRAYGSTANNYQSQVKTSRDGATKTLTRSDVPGWGYGSVVSFYIDTK